MGPFVRTSAVLLGLAALAGCVSPFAQRASYDRKMVDAPGTISVSDPKLYTREALISERARDVTWIDGLITQSEDPTKVTFKPELYREIEQISSFSAALGLKYDPAAALSYRRNTETGEIQQQIDVLKLQIQLDQLRRDAELVRAGFANQTSTVNTDVGKLGDASGGASTPVSASASDQLKAAIDKLLPALTGRLDADGKPVTPTIAMSSPSDDFRDRSAYRDLLKSARNSAELDALHDSGNARLIRLSFQASVLPEKNFGQSLGAVQIRVVPPASSGPTTLFLRNWLDYLNTDTLYRASDGSIKHGDLVDGLIDSGRFRRVQLGRASGAGGVSLLLPVLVGSGGLEWEPEDLLGTASWDRTEPDDVSQFDEANGVLSQTESPLRNICTGSLASEAKTTDRLELTIEIANAREASYNFYLLADKVAHAHGLPFPLTDDIQAKQRRAHRYLENVKALMAAQPACSAFLQRGFSAPDWWAFRDSSVTGRSAVRIYEVGPREQVQQISTVARSANSLALAASLAGSAPGSGVAADAAASYSRQAIGRATALERAPSVVGYSVAGDGVFGWVLGPRAVIDARGKVEMEQMLKPYDLSVDLSVPGWWAGLQLEITTIWAPAPNLIANGTLAARKLNNARRIYVPLVRSVADYDALSDYFIGASAPKVTIDAVLGGPVNACTDSTLLIRGQNLWRAQRVLVLGNLIEGNKLVIMPDMRGIQLTVPAIKQPPNINLDRTIYVMTPLGMALSSDPVTYLAEPSGGACTSGKPLAAAGGAGANAVTVSDAIIPGEFIVPSKVRLRLTGTNLKNVSKVLLGGQEGAYKAADDGKSATIDFTESDTSSVRPSDNTELQFLDKDDKPITTRRLRTIARPQ